jgi:hypothetical protein
MMHTLEKNFDVARIVIILKLQQEESKVLKKKNNLSKIKIKKHVKQLGTREFKWAKGATSSLEAKRTKNYT